MYCLNNREGEIVLTKGRKIRKKWHNGVNDLKKQKNKRSTEQTRAFERFNGKY
jgi:hypothetical protein